MTLGTVKLLEKKTMGGLENLSWELLKVPRPGAVRWGLTG